MNENKYDMVIHSDNINLSSIVSVPIPEQDHYYLSKDIHSVEESYYKKIDEVTEIEKKICYDRARAVCKWAAHCGATLKSRYVKQGQLYFVFSFSSLEHLKDFRTNARMNIGTTEQLKKMNRIRR